VARYDWKIPVRLDLGSGPSDLSGDARLRSVRTVSPLDLIVAMGLRSKGWG
jgi:hypothetical protein